MDLVWKASSCCGQGSKQILGTQVPCGSDRPLLIKSITWHRQPWLGWIVPTHPLPHYTPARKCQSENITNFGTKCDTAVRTGLFCPTWKPKLLTVRKYAPRNDSEFLSFGIRRKSYEIFHETNSAVIILGVFVLLHFACFLRLCTFPGFWAFTLSLVFKILHFA